MSPKSYEKLSKLANKINLKKDPEERINLVQDLAEGIGRVLMLPSPIIEQTIKQLEEELSELKTYEDKGSPVSSFIMEHKDFILAKSSKVLGLLKAFQEVRPHIKKRLIEITGCKPTDIPD